MAKRDREKKAVPVEKVGPMRVVRRKADERKKLPPHLESYARGETRSARKPPAPSEKMDDPRSSFLVTGVANRLARAVCDAHVERLKAAVALGEAGQAELASGLVVACKLGVWRGRSVVDFDAFVDGVLGVTPDAARALLRDATGSDTLPELLPEKQVALWMRTEGAAREAGADAAVSIDEAGMLRLALPLATVSTAFAAIGREHAPLAGGEQPHADAPREGERQERPRDDRPARPGWGKPRDERGPREDRPPRTGWGKPRDDAGPPGPPRRDDRGPPRDDRGPPRDDRGPPRPAWGKPRDDRGPRRDDRGPPRRDDRGPPRRDDRGPPRDDRGPPRAGSARPAWGKPRDDRGPRRDDRGPPRRDDRGPPRDDRGPPRRDDRGPPRAGNARPAWGKPRDDRGPPRRDDRGPPRRDDRGPPRRDDRGPPRAGAPRPAWGKPRDDRGAAPRGPRRTDGGGPPRDARPRNDGGAPPRRTAWSKKKPPDESGSGGTES